MQKVCNNCNKYKVFSKGLCLSCDRKEHPEKYAIKRQSTPKLASTSNYHQEDSTKVTKTRKPLKRARKATGELELFKSIYVELNGKCQITGKQLPFNVCNFAHALSKKAYPSFRLLRENICHCDPQIHFLYDNSSKEKLLAYEPRAILLYELKDKLRYLYYNS